ncbi:hypothetical protein [Rickettsia tamurae]|uniref:Uncharacterized protein n=1 Tax=Rickettsia tamurae subsp. buchneri TaxID=1462938 RepID=A0A8E1C0G8_9RICK|nr:hypothetical protein REISMN_01895 [Rickettsia tamurae subsp. buchneri]
MVARSKEMGEIVKKWTEYEQQKKLPNITTRKRDRRICNLIKAVIIYDKGYDEKVFFSNFYGYNLYYKRVSLML